MPNAKQTNASNVGTVLAIIGKAGEGKSQFAIQAPQPHAILCVDKPAIATLPAWFPDYDPAQSFGKFYPPPDVDLTDAKALPPRNVFDAIWADIKTLRTALYEGKPTFKMGDEEWPLPRSIIIEGGDFIRSHATNWVLNIHGKKHMDEFQNGFLGWGLVADKMLPLYKSLTFLPAVRPVNVIITIGVNDEMRNEKSGGKVEQVATGKKVANFGGKKLDQEAPRSFHNMWLALSQGGRYYIATSKGTKYEQYENLRSSRVGVPQLVDVTLESKAPKNFWNELFGNPINP